MVDERQRSDEYSLVQTIMDSTSEALMVVNEVGEIIFANKVSMKLNGKVLIDRLTNEKIENVLEFEKGNVKNYVSDVIKNQEVLLLSDVKLLDADGCYKIIECRFQPMSFEGDRSVAISIIDVTRWKNTENALRHSEETYSKAEMIAHIGSWDWNIVTNDLRWTDEIYRIFGLKPQEFGATYDAFLEAVHPEDQQIVVDAVNAAVSNINVQYSIEHRVVQPSGDIRVVHEHGKVYRDENEKPIRMIGTVHDITERKSADTQLEKYRNELELIVDERTKKLQEAQDELVRKERLAALGQLTATVSHELRNPLAAMSPSIYVLKHKLSSNDEVVTHALQRLERNIERCDKIIDELLDFTRIVDLDLVEIEIDKWLDSLIEEHGIPGEVELEKTFGLSNMKLKIDPDRLGRAIINVLDNAIQAMQDDMGKVVEKEAASLKVFTTLKDDNVVVSIEDTGKGIADDIMDKIFEPLFSTKGFGVGLGMPTVKQIVEQHRGSIRITSLEGKGTNIEIRLPVCMDR